MFLFNAKVISTQIFGPQKSKSRDIKKKGVVEKISDILIIFFYLSVV